MATVNAITGENGNRLYIIGDGISFDLNNMCIVDSADDTEHDERKQGKKTDIEFRVGEAVKKLTNIPINLDEFVRLNNVTKASLLHDGNSIFHELGLEGIVRFKTVGGIKMIFLEKK